MMKGHIVITYYQKKVFELGKNLPCWGNKLTLKGVNEIGSYYEIWPRRMLALRDTTVARGTKVR